MSEWTQRGIAALFGMAFVSLCLVGLTLAPIDEWWGIIVLFWSGVGVLVGLAYIGGALFGDWL